MFNSCVTYNSTVYTYSDTISKKMPLLMDAFTDKDYFFSKLL